MESLKEYRSDLIKRISAIENKEFLKSIENFLNDYQEPPVYKTTDSEKKAIFQGVNEIQNGNYFSQEEIDAKDLQWLSEK